MFRNYCFVAFAAVCFTFPLTASAQIGIDQLLDFESGSTSGFVVGAAAPPSVVPTVITEPDGNQALQLSTNGTGAGPGHALQVFNDSFASDLSSAQVLFFNATNPNAEDLNIRVSFSAGSTADNFVNPTGAFTSNDILLPGGSSQDLAFSLDASNFSQIFGTASFTETISNVQQLRIFHNPAVVASPFGLAGADAIGGLQNPVAGTLLIDNVIFSSTAVPEPSALSLMVGALIAQVSRRRKRECRV